MSIKCEVVFSTDIMRVNNWNICSKGDSWEVFSGNKSERFYWLEDAIKYCMEQRDE